MIAEAKNGIKESLYKYRLLLGLMEHTPDVIYFKDRKGRLVMVNDPQAKELGLAPEDIAGKTDFDIHPKRRAAIIAEMTAML